MGGFLKEVARRLARPLLRSLLLGAPRLEELEVLLPPDLAGSLGRIAVFFESEVTTVTREGRVACRLCGRVSPSRRGLFQHLLRTHSTEIVAVLEDILEEEARRLGSM